MTCTEEPERCHDLRLRGKRDSQKGWATGAFSKMNLKYTSLGCDYERVQRQDLWMGFRMATSTSNNELRA